MNSVDDLRLEVQCHYGILHQLLGSDRPFGIFLNEDYCRDFISSRYKGLISSPDCDFYTLKAAGEKIEQSSHIPTIQRNLIDTMRSIAMNHSVTESHMTRYKAQMATLGIHWFPIPARLVIDHLPSPFSHKATEYFSGIHKKPT